MKIFKTTTWLYALTLLFTSSALAQANCTIQNKLIDTYADQMTHQYAIAYTSTTKTQEKEISDAFLGNVNWIVDLNWTRPSNTPKFPVFSLYGYTNKLTGVNSVYAYQSGQADPITGVINYTSTKYSGFKLTSQSLSYPVSTSSTCPAVVRQYENGSGQIIVLTIRPLANQFCTASNSFIKEGPASTTITKLFTGYVANLNDPAQHKIWKVTATLKSCQ